MDKDIRTNMSLASLSKLVRYGVINGNLEITRTHQYMRELKIKASSIQQKVKNLSGGNQQKVILAKWMLTSPEVLILDEPTRGVDVGAKYEICLLYTSRCV